MKRIDKMSKSRIEDMYNNNFRVDLEKGSVKRAYFNFRIILKSLKTQKRRLDKDFVDAIEDKNSRLKKLDYKTDKGKDELKDMIEEFFEDDLDTEVEKTW